MYSAETNFLKIQRTTMEDAVMKAKLESIQHMMEKDLLALKLKEV
jgi:hypothetical protein